MARRRKIVLTKKWSDYIDLHKDKDFIICGRGRSLQLLKDTNSILIGVNDIEKYRSVDYLVVVDRIAQFTRENRHEEILNTKSDTFFTQIDEYAVGYSNFNYDKVCKINIKNIRQDHQIDKNICYASNNSTFIACSIAINMGARNIGIIGVDITGHKSLASENSLKKINRDYSILNNLHKIYNLSPISKIEALETISIDDFHKLNTNK